MHFSLLNLQNAYIFEYLQFETSLCLCNKKD